MFAYIPLLAILFVVTQVYDWAGDEEAGRLELLLAQPLARAGIRSTRYCATVLGLLGVLLLFGVLVLVAAAGTGVAFNAGRLVAATGALVPVALLVLALAPWLRRPLQAVGLTASRAHVLAGAAGPGVRLAGVGAQPLDFPSLWSLTAGGRRLRQHARAGGVERGPGGVQLCQLPAAR